MTLDIILAVTAVLAALATVTTARLLRAVIAMALTSAIVSVILFRLHSPIAAVFELSVGSGLVPAIFLSAITMTQRMTPEALSLRKREKLRTYWALPGIVILVGVAMLYVRLPVPAAPTASPASVSVRVVLWNLRHMDLLGQIVVLLGGAFGVAVLVKELDSER
jgi:uncharacterized MnhB-related membrane protein